MTASRATSTDFARVLREQGAGAVTRGPVETLQVNLGRRCNMACRHCHVDAGPNRAEVMARDVAVRVIELLAASPRARTLDLTGGAPELCPSFRFLVRMARRLGREVIDRCNLSVLLEPGMEDLGDFLAEHGVHVVASLPCYTAANVDRQRGAGAFDRSVAALRALNALGYGMPGSPLGLDLVYNPLGASLPPAQGDLERRYADALRTEHGIEFHGLRTITNMPLSRFARALERDGDLHGYMQLLRESFNGETVHGVMCRSLVSVGWDGGLYDCDFNQIARLPLEAPGPRTIWDLDSLDRLEGRRVTTADHCFGCTAGAGSGCSGALS